MIFSELITQVYRILEDPGQFAWPNSAVALQLQEAVRDVANQMGTADGRIALDMVQGTETYLLPKGVRRINNIRILPEIQPGGSQAEAGCPLDEVELARFPVVSVQEAEPRLFTLSSVGGPTLDQHQLMMFPTPARSATGAFIINYGIEYPFTSTDPADGAANAQIIPFPPQYDKVIIYKTAAGLLNERTDESDIRKGEFFDGKANEILRPMLPVRSTEFKRDLNRAFP